MQLSHSVSPSPQALLKAKQISMDHMNHMQHIQAVSTFSLSTLLSGLFLLGAFFYCFRFFSRKYLLQVNGYQDRENEFWHLACMMAMVSSLAPAWFEIPDLFWQIAFAIGTICYLVRVFTYGLRLPFNKQWYDFAHAAMTFGMFWMFAVSVNGLATTIIFTAYWAWFGSYYAVRFYDDFKRPHWLSFGQDIAHLAMAVVMVLMLLLPATFHHHHHVQDPGMSCQTMPEMPECSPVTQGK